MKLQKVKFWHDNQAVYDHLYQTFVVERVSYNFLDGVPVYVPVAGSQGCAIGNLLVIQHSFVLHILSKAHREFEDIETVLTAPPIVNDTVRLIQRIFSNVDVELLVEFQKWHDLRNLRENTFMSIADNFGLNYHGVRIKIKCPTWEEYWDASQRHKEVVEQQV